MIRTAVEGKKIYSISISIFHLSLQTFRISVGRRPFVARYQSQISCFFVERKYASMIFRNAVFNEDAVLSDKVYCIVAPGPFLSDALTFKAKNFDLPQSELESSGSGLEARSSKMRAR